MFRVVTNIIIEQITQIPEAAKPRGLTLTFNFGCDYECNDGWRDLTKTGKITVPKNLYYRDATGTLKSLNGTNTNAGGFDNSNPLIMRGDKITLDWGYRYFQNNKEIFVGTQNNQTGTHLFTGWVSEVTSKKPIEFKIEDNMWKLKQIAAPLKTYPKTATLENILTDLLTGTPYTVNALTSTTFGEFRVGNETVCEVLARLRKMYHFESYFRGNELRSGANPYIESEAIQHTFTFQKDIITDDLEYRRKDDIVLSIVASNTIEENNGTCKDGTTEKTKKTRLEVLVTLKNGASEPTYFIKTKGIDYPPNTGGERMVLTYPGVKTIDDLKTLATVEIKKYFYTGFKGKFIVYAIAELFPYTTYSLPVNVVFPVIIILL